MTCRDGFGETGEVELESRGGVVPDAGQSVVDVRSAGVRSLPVQSVAAWTTALQSQWSLEGGDRSSKNGERENGK